MKPLHVFAALLVAVIWGLNFLFIREGILDLPPLVLLTLRFIFVAVPLVFFIPRPRVPWWVLAGIGLFMSAGQFSWVYSAIDQGLPIGVAPLVVQSQMFFTVFLALFLFKEHPTRFQWIGMSIGILGLVVVAAGRGGAGASLWPFVMALLSGLFWGIGNTFARRAQGASGLSIVVWSALWVPIPLLLVSLVLYSPEVVFQSFMHITPRAWKSTLFTVLMASLIGYSIWNGLLGKYPAAVVAPFTLLVPPIGMLAAWLALGERPNFLEILGGALLLLGVFATLKRPEAPKLREPGASAVPPSQSGAGS